MDYIFTFIFIHICGQINELYIYISKSFPQFAIHIFWQVNQIDI